MPDREVSLFDDAALRDAFVRATDLPVEIVEGLMASDSDLDALCDAALSDLAAPSKNSGRATR